MSEFASSYSYGNMSENLENGAVNISKALQSLLILIISNSSHIDYYTQRWIINLLWTNGAISIIKKISGMLYDDDFTTLTGSISKDILSNMRASSADALLLMWPIDMLNTSPGYNLLLTCGPLIYINFRDIE